MTLKHDQRVRRLALAALALDEPTPADGERPSLEELWDWMGGEVAAPRAAQIAAHLARDPELHEDWRQLRLAVEEDKQRSMAPQRDPGSRPESSPERVPLLERLLGWMTPEAFGGAFATAAVLGIAIGVSQQSPEVDLWQDWQVLKSSEAAVPEASELPELRAFLVGMREQMRRLSIAPHGPDGNRLPNQLERCDDGDDACAKRRETLRRLGSLSVLSRFDCLLDNRWRPERQGEAASLVRTLTVDGPEARLFAPLQQWVSAENEQQRCGAIEEALARGLLGLDARGS